ncbi:MAG: hypothetical protein ACP5VC_14520 [Bryobacteraceae bacterium]
MALRNAEILAFRPGTNSALVVGADGAVGLLHLRPEEPDATWQALREAVHDPDIAAWSPCGDGLVLASAAEGRLQVWHIEDNFPKLAYELPLAPTRAAVSDAGTVLAEVDGALYTTGPDGSMRTVTAQAAGPFTFLAGSERYAWLDGGRLRMEGAGEAPLTVGLPEGADPRRVLLLSIRGAPLAAASPGDEGTLLTAWNESGEKIGQWQCPVAAARLWMAGPEGVVQLVSGDDGPVWMALFENTGARIFFVPRAREEAEQP